MFRRNANKPFYDIGRSREAADFFADELERLMALPLTTKADVEHWYAERSETEKILKKRFPNFEFWHEVWHFLHDPDIRARDVGYRDYQHGLMRDYVACLRSEPPNA
jgi:hypothetical protein